MQRPDSIRFFYQAPGVNLRERTRLKSFIQNIFKREGRKLEGLNYIFCSDKELLKINQQYLKHNDYTDIITFDLSEDPRAILGEIYISIDRIRDNAKRQGNPIRSELHRVIFHGVLHLCGYKDKTRKEIQEIRKMEDHYLSLFLK